MQGQQTNFRVTPTSNLYTIFNIGTNDNSTPPVVQNRPNLAFYSVNEPGWTTAIPSLELNRDGSLSLYQSIWGSRPTTNTATSTFGTTMPYKIITFAQNGRVTIGNTRPGNYINNASESANYKLAVDGKIVCKNWVVTQTAWADSVFTDKHQLPTLDSVAAFINTHHHLPVVKSETQVKEMGIDGADMLKDQMAKIEELYLYTIQLKKDLDKEKAQNQALQSQVAKIAELESKMDALLKRNK